MYVLRRCTQIAQGGKQLGMHRMHTVLGLPPLLPMHPCDRIHPAKRVLRETMHEVHICAVRTTTMVLWMTKDLSLWDTDVRL